MADFRHTRLTGGERKLVNNARIGLAACAVIVARVAAGCGSSSTSGNSAAKGGPGMTVTGSSSATPE
jgi:hypothetical protein